MHDWIAAAVAEDEPWLVLVAQPAFGGNPNAGLHQRSFDPVEFGYLLL
jgi:hypothetical protein